ncbi:MAG: hypothetical protein ACI9LG_001722 [Moritella dasanensis]|jgi:hypothetical protein
MCLSNSLRYAANKLELNFNIDHKRHISLDNQKVIDQIYHIQTLNNFMMRWKTWMKRFYGVGTGYMDHYIAWFIFIENKASCEKKIWFNEALA